MIVQLAGLPGTGKSTLAAGLHRHFGDRCLVLDKDRVRAALYDQPGQVTYHRDQDDFVVSLLHLAARERLGRDPDAVVVLERTCTRAYQIEDVAQLAVATGQALAVIHCWCPDAIARDRLDTDRRSGRHPAANRTFGLYQRLRKAADPISITALRLRTDTTADEVLTAAVSYLDQFLDISLEAAVR